MAMHTAGVPASELAAWRAELAPRYGAKLVDEGDRRILIVRVPRGEPDPVNDVEAAVDFLDPDAVAQMTHCILIGDTRIAQVYAGPLQDLMLERTQFDAQEVMDLRAKLPRALDHQVYRSESDPRRSWRMAIRIPCESVKELEESHLETVADELGAQLTSAKLAELTAVYIIADQDHVRLEADHVVGEMRTSWQDEDRKRRKAEELRAKEETDRRAKEAERRAIVRELDRAMKERETVRERTREAVSVSRARKVGPQSISRDAVAQLAREATPEEPLLSAESDVITRPDPFRGREPRGPAHDAVAAVIAERKGEVDGLQAKVDDLAQRAGDVRPGESPKQAVARKLSLLGFDVLMDPETDAPIDLAAERSSHAPHHLVVRVVDRLGAAEAQALVDLGRDTNVDHVLCVAEQADDDARRIVTGSKVTWFRPRELRTLRL